MKNALPQALLTNRQFVMAPATSMDLQVGLILAELNGARSSIDLAAFPSDRLP